MFLHRSTYTRLAVFVFLQKSNQGRTTTLNLSEKHILSAIVCVLLSSRFINASLQIFVNLCEYCKPIYIRERENFAEFAKTWLL